MAHLKSISICVILIAVNSSLSHVVPRITFPLDSPARPVTIVTLSDVYNTTTLLLSEDEETLFVGARDAILSFSIGEGGSPQLNRKLDWSPTEKDLQDCSMKGKEQMDCPNFVRVLQVLNSTHMYACGTFAFSPRCTYINSQQFSLVMGSSGKPEEGRGRCPYDPYQKNTAITVDGELYTGTVADYRGNRPVISRHLSEGGHVDLKLDDTVGWLEDPTFVSSTYVPSEEKVYFFFSEIGREYDFIDKFTVSRIAQVCTSDIGGQRTLQRRWTTFTKAQLLCQANGELPYNVLQDVATLLPPEGTSEEDVLFYGIFSSQWSVNSGRSAVCVFSLKAVKDVFAGNYKVLNRDTLKWSTRVQEKIANPGECGLHNASDNTLRYVKENFLADQSVLPVSQSLAIVSHDQRYSNIAAQRVQGAHGKQYTVLYLLSESGYLHKAVLLEKNAHIIEEIQVFKSTQVVKGLLLSVSKGVVFVGSSEGVASIPVSNCSYYRSCADCVLARDPFCGWDPKQQTCADVSSIGKQVVQDVDDGNVTKVCTIRFTPRSNTVRSPTPSCPPGELVSVSLNEFVSLQCPTASRLANLRWEKPSSQLSPYIYRQHEDGTLSFLATPSTLGDYECQAVENGFTRTLAIYKVKQKSSPVLQPFTPSRTQSTQPSETARETVGSTPRWLTSKLTTEKLDPETTTALQESPVMTTQMSKRNFTHRLGSAGSVGEDVDSRREKPQLQATSPSYLKELVAVSVLLVLCLSLLLTIALYNFRQQFRKRTVPHASNPRRDPEEAVAATLQERESLRGQSPRGEKRNGQANGGKSPITRSNGMLNGSNGHLPNTPIHPSDG